MIPGHLEHIHSHNWVIRILVIRGDISRDPVDPSPWLGRSSPLVDLDARWHRCHLRKCCLLLLTDSAAGFLAQENVCVNKRKHVCVSTEGKVCVNRRKRMCQQKEKYVSTEGNVCVNRRKRMCQQKEKYVSTEGNMCQQKEMYVSTEGNVCVNRRKRMCKQLETYVSTGGNVCVNRRKCMCQQEETYVSTEGNICVNRRKRMCQQEETYVSTEGNICVNRRKRRVIMVCNRNAIDNYLLLSNLLPLIWHLHFFFTITITYHPISCTNKCLVCLKTFKSNKYTHLEIHFVMALAGVFRRTVDLFCLNTASKTVSTLITQKAKTNYSIFIFT